MGRLPKIQSEERAGQKHWGLSLSFQPLNPLRSQPVKGRQPSWSASQGAKLGRKLRRGNLSGWGGQRRRTSTRSRYSRLHKLQVAGESPCCPSVDLASAVESELPLKPLSSWEKSANPHRPFAANQDDYEWL